MRDYVSFESVIDIGCGVAQVLMACYESGVGVIRGVDGSWVNEELLLIPSEQFTQYDLSRPGIKDEIPEKHFDLTISSEVAEHIDPEDTETYMDNLTSFSDMILFSAAIPGQGGTHHVNEQWPSYWIEKFRARGFVPVDCIRSKIWDDKEIRPDYRQNLMFFVREDKLNDYPALATYVGGKVFDLVHPDLFTMRIEALMRATDIPNMAFRSLCKIILSALFYLPRAFIRAVKKRLPAW
ncbi:MAG: class I SAM-dependent methyltransferase [Synergistaceae bacterium]|nr:class I SAM-dependent methyltransferase [Synergistaceae bacterium]